MSPADVDFDGLRAYGWNERWAALAAGADSADGFPARVLRHDGVSLLVATPAGIDRVPPRATLEAVTVGDWVVVEDGAARSLLPRASLLRREDPSGREQLLAANVDLILVVCGFDRPLRAGRIQRAVAQAWDAGAVPHVVLTKADLAADGAPHQEAVEEGAPGVDLHIVSAATGSGLDELEALVVGRTLVLVGESGAGKSTLLNALAGTDLAATGEVRSGDAKGRHTTTTRELHLLPGGGCVIDSPGLRSFGLWTDTDAVDAAFSDVEEAATGCRFRDCRHDGEPGCAVAGAVDAGNLAPERLEAWQRLRREAEAAALRADEHARRTRDRQFGKISREAQRVKRRD